MARENVATFIGTVETTDVIFDKENQTCRLSLTISVIRPNGREDHPRITVYGLTNQAASETCLKLKFGSTVMARGMVTTVMKKKEVICPKCGARSIADYLDTEIAAFDVPVVLEGEQDMQMFRELSNSVQVMGKVCSSVNRSANDVTMYQLRIERKYPIEQQPEKFDVPWVKSFGAIAANDFEHLGKNSLVYINGSFQTREIMMAAPCKTKGCDGVLGFKYIGGEVISRNVEYLNDCYFESKERVKNEQTRINKIGAGAFDTNYRCQKRGYVS